MNKLLDLIHDKICLKVGGYHSAEMYSSEEVINICMDTCTRFLSKIETLKDLETLEGYLDD